jgi:hypothetical protein
MCAAITTMAIGAAAAGYQIYQGEQTKKKAQNALDAYKRQDLVNPFKDVQISTMGSDLMREENQRTSADLVDASRNGGIRGVMGGIPKIQAFTNDANREAQVYLDNQVQKRDYAIAGDQTALRDMKEMRDNNNINALSSQMMAGEQNMWSGIRGMGTSLSYGANNIDWSGKGSKADRDRAKLGKGSDGSGNYTPDYLSITNNQHYV